MRANDVATRFICARSLLVLDPRARKRRHQVLARKERGLTGEARHRVRQAVTEVQPRRVPAPAVAALRLHRLAPAHFAKRDLHHAQLVEEPLEQPARLLGQTRVEDDPRFG